MSGHRAIHSVVRNRRPPDRRGFTLLEVLLAIAISVLVLGVVGTVIYFQLHVVESSRGEIEQAQLARAVLQYIADDLRNVVKYDPQDVKSMMPDASSMEDAAGAAMGGTDGASGSTSGGTGGSGGGGNGGGATGGASGGSSGTGNKTSGGSGLSGGPGNGLGATGFAAGGGNTTGGSNSTGGMGGTTSGGSTSKQSTGGSANTSGQGNAAKTAGGTASSSNNAESSDTLAADEIPGLWGDEYWLKIDVSRLPRRDQLLAPDATGGQVSRASDLKTVEYFVNDPDGATDGMGGLRRREVSRAESLMATQQGNETALAQVHEKVLAKEVVAIQFQYYDGQQWQTTWPPSQTEEQQKRQQLPLAVQVILTFRPKEAEASSGMLLADPAAMASYPQRRIIVNLPAAEPASEQDTSEQVSGEQGSSGQKTSGQTGAQQ